MLKYFLTILIAIIIPTYTINYGPQNFLWASDIALFLICIALWLNSSLLISIVALLTMLLELMWTFDFFYNLLTGINILNIAGYMFDPNLSLFLRGLSLFHLLLPAVSLFYLFKWGYNQQALKYALVLFWSVILVCYLFTPVSENINWVHYPSLYNWENISPNLWVLSILVLYPILIMLPKSMVFKKVFNKNRSVLQ